MRLSEEYKVWIDTANKFVLYTGAWRRATKIPGLFSAEIVIDIGERRRAGDLDNRIKAILDWCQARDLVRNDRDLEELTIRWGEAPHGCRITLREVWLSWRRNCGD